TKKALAFGQAKYAAYQAAQADAIAAKSAEALAQASEIAAFTALEKAKAKEVERLAELAAAEAMVVSTRAEMIATKGTYANAAANKAHIDAIALRNEADRSATLATNARAAAEKRLSTATIATTATVRQQAEADRDAAASALAAARADVAAIQAKLTYAQSMVMVAVRKREVTRLTDLHTLATNRLTAAENALAAANTRVAAATGSATTALRGALALVGGWAGVAAIVATAATSLLFFRDSAKEAKEALIDFSRPLEEVRKEFDKFSVSAKNAEIALQRQNLRKLKKEYEELADGVRKSMEEMARGWMAMPGELGSLDLNFTEDAKRFARTISQEAKNATFDWNQLSEAIQNNTAMTDREKESLQLMIGTLETFQTTMKATEDNVRAMEDSMRSAAGGTKENEEALEGLRKRLAAINNEIYILQNNNSVEAQVEVMIRVAGVEGGGKEVEQIRKDIEDSIRLRTRLQEQNKRGGRGGTKADPYLQQAEALTRQLFEANLKLADAQNGVTEGTRQAANALAVWLATGKDAKNLTEAQRNDLIRQAEAIDEAATAYKELADAKRRADELRDTGFAIEIEVLRLLGNNSEADRREAKKRAADFAEQFKVELERQDPAVLKVKAELDKAISLSGMKRELDSLLSEIDRYQESAAKHRETINVTRETGGLSSLQAQEAILKANLEQARQLEGILPALREMAKMPGEMGKQATAALIDVENQIKLLNATMSDFERTLKEGVSSGLSQALNGLIDGTMNLREAISALASTVSRAMIDMAARGIAEDITGSLFGKFGAGKEAGEAATNAAEQALLTQQQTLVATAQGVVTQMQAMLGQEQAMQAAEQALLAQEQLLPAQEQMAATQLQTAAAQLQAAATAQSATAAGGEAAGEGGVLGSLVSFISGLFGQQQAVVGQEMVAATTQQTAAITLQTAAIQLQTAAMALSASGGSNAAGGIAGAIGGAAGGMSFAEGGYTGSGGKHAPAGIVHKGEFVIPAALVRIPGMRTYLEQLLRLKGYASGGYVPAAPAITNPMRDITMNWKPEQVSMGNTNVDNKLQFQFIDDPARAAYNAFRTKEGVKQFTIMLSRDPQKFRQILGV
ncbi:MAG: hypothetical protein FWH15_09490, partial [Betaproteobacteria bacterium]|nr:hypothetical protein [Betaproteobacteria bacterium]